MFRLLTILTLTAATALAKDQLSLTPSGEITPETPSLEAAFPGEMSIQRTAHSGLDTVAYSVEIYAPEAVGPGAYSFLTSAAIVVKDGKGAELLAAPLAVSGVGHSSNQIKSRTLYFTVHASVEATTVINLGRHDGMRILFTRYKLPLRSIDHPKAEKLR